ncbi:MAG: hypothetical protein RJB66_94 [Pseudomonadota bacterium]|jgi:ferrochelatase
MTFVEEKSEQSGRPSTKGVLLVDIGTPSELSREAVRSYLEDFFGDPFVVRAPRWLRELALRRLIIPFRLNKYFDRYQRVWSEEGAPLRVEAGRAVEALTRELFRVQPESSWVVRFAFHFGGPSIESQLEDMKASGVTEVVVVPLFPQWSLSTRGSLEDRLKKLKIFSSPEDKGFGFDHVSVTPVFYDHDGFIEAQSQLLEQFLPKDITDEIAVVFSFHGLPEGHLKAVVPDCKKCLKRGSDCRPNAHVKPFCYRYQCLETARRIAIRSGLFHWDVAFQSKVAPSRWIEPSLQEVVDDLLEQGVKTMVVLCPSFVFDNVESLDEVGQEMREYFLRQGGRSFFLVPALNNTELWIKTLCLMVLEQN